MTSTAAQEAPSRVDRRVQEFRARVLKTAQALVMERGVDAMTDASLVGAGSTRGALPWGAGRGSGPLRRAL